MRKLALLPVLVLGAACSDGAPLEPADAADPQIVAKTSGNPHNPFVGSWWGVDWEDGSLHHLKISHENAFGDMQVMLRDDVSSLCDGRPGSFHSIGRIVSVNVLKVIDPVVVCRGPGGDETPFGSIFGYEYVPEDDELRYCVIPETTPVVCVMNLSREKPAS